MGSAKRSTPNEGVLRTAINTSAVLVIAVLSAVILANSMTKEVSRDEQMYCTAGALLAQGEMIYQDFSYPAQLPYHPLLLAALYRGLKTTHFLLVGRLVSVVCDIAVMISIIGVFRSAFGRYRLEGLLLGLAATALYVFNPLVDYAAGYAWNHDVVILCVVLSFWLLITTDVQHTSRYWRVAVIGALLTVATCMRATTALVELVFLGSLLVLAGGSVKNRSQTALPVSVAALVVLAWPIWVVVQAPYAFWLNLVRIPALYGRWLHKIGMAHGKTALTIASLATPGYLALLVVAGYLAWVLLRRSSGMDVQDRQRAVLAALLPLVFFLIAYIPPTMWRQYLAVPVPFIVIGFAYPLAELRKRAENVAGRRRFTIACYLVGLGAAVSVLTHPAPLFRSVAVLVPENWVPTELHNVSVDIAGKAKEPKLVLTLGPLQALEGGCDIYRELACGSIVYRVADLMSTRQREVTKTVGPATLAELVMNHPPSAVVAGVEPSYFSSLEDPLRRLVPPDWHRVTYEDGLQVHFRP